jgi:anti-sigma regulatory factor (Ser/Thr protein kinase)
MGSAQQPERGAAGGHDTAADPPVPDEVPLDQRFRSGDLYALRAAVAAHASSLGAAPGQVESLVIVASELATNAIVHGGGSGRLRLWQLDGEVALQVSDAGHGLLDPEHAGTERRSPAALGGRGLWITRELCDRVAITSSPAGTTVTAAVRIEDQPAATD